MSDDDFVALRRQFDEHQINRIAEFGTAIMHLRQAFEESLRSSAQIQANQAAMIERITAFNEKFLEHDEREGEDRIRIITAIEMMTRELAAHQVILARQDEQIGSLRQWSLYLAATIGSIATGGVVWIIQHLQSVMK